LLGPKAFHGTKGYIASVIVHEGKHVLQVINGRPPTSGPGGYVDEAEAYRMQLETAREFELLPSEVHEVRSDYNSYYRLLSPGDRKVVDEPYGGAYEPD
jgi:hypothetical protein